MESRFGKFAVLNKKIIYFDMYMTFGAWSQPCCQLL